MSYKTYLLAGALALGIAAGDLQHRAYANNPDAGAIVIAQNNEKPGLFNRIFNSNKNNSAAKPLFLNEKASSAGVKPYDFSRNARKAGNRGSVSWEAFERQREEHARQVAARAQIAANRLQQNSQRIVEAQLAKMATGSAAKQQDTQKSQKKMAYDPQRAWTYDPNASSNSSGAAPRIYNSRSK